MTPPSPSRRRVIFTWLFGVLLPTGTLFFESLSGFCAEYLFDPLPSFLHQVVVALVPLGFLYVLNIASPVHPKRHRMPFVLGAISAIALIYTFPFVPLLAAAFVALIYYGLGFLPLAPLFALLVALGWTLWLAKRGDMDGFWKRCVGGFLVGLLLFAVADGRRLLTHWGFETLAADEATAERLVPLLRTFGVESEMLRLCLRFGTHGMLYSADVESAEARRIYFRVTGRVVIEDLRREEALERNIGAVVAGQTTWRLEDNLFLRSSHINADLDPAVPLAYLQWEMLLHNTGVWPQEALAEIALPDGAVVSRATLWIEGEPREAAFGGRAQVTAAYEEVAIVRRKDPLLVTTAGPDRVRLRAFPVPPQGEMRLLLGITAPLDVVRAIEGRLDLPYFAERNFRLEKGTRHRIELVNRGRPQRLYAPKGLANPFEMNNAELASFETFVAIRRDETQTAFWRGDDPEAPDLLARLVSGPRPQPRHLVVVIDGSAASEAFRGELTMAVQRLATVWPGLEVVLAGDAVQTHSAGGEGQSAASWLDGRAFVGGRDNAPALLRGIELARAQNGGAVLWMGAPQVINLTPSEELKQRLLDGKALPPIFVLPLAPGPQRLWDAFETVPHQVLPRYGSLEEDLAGLPGVDSGRRFVELRFALPGEPLPSRASAASSHLERLWAAEQVGRLLRRGDTVSEQQALALAVEHQLVTPVSGAVVLETAEQYEAHDLQPVPPSTVPTIPEPEVWALLLAALASGLVLWRRQVRA